MANLELVLLLALCSFFAKGQARGLEVSVSDIDSQVQTIASRADDMICFLNNQKVYDKATADALQFISTKAEDVLNRAKEVSSMINSVDGTTKFQKNPHSASEMMEEKINKLMKFVEGADRLVELAQKQIDKASEDNAILTKWIIALDDKANFDRTNQAISKLENLVEIIEKKLAGVIEGLGARETLANAAHRAEQANKLSEDNTLNDLEDETNFSQETQTLPKLEKLIEIIDKKLVRIPEEHWPFLVLPDGNKNHTTNPDWLKSLKGTLKYVVGDLQLLLPPQVLHETITPKMCNDKPSAIPLKTTLDEPQCESGWDLFCSGYTCQCYQLGAVSLNWEEARKYCQSRSADLASIHSRAEQKFLEGYLSPKLGAWVGLSKVGKTDSYKWSDETQVKFTNWYPLKPSGGSCSVMDRTLWFAWNDIDCRFRERNLALICKKTAMIQKSDDSLAMALKMADDPLPTPLTMYRQLCQEGWDQLCTEFTCFCYQLGPASMEWEGARGFCMGRDADLASVETAEEQKLLGTYLDSKLGVRMSAVWIGLNRVRPGKSFDWSDSSQVNYMNWETKATGNCGVMDRRYSFAWDVIDCRYQGLDIAVLCKKATTLEIADAPSTKLPDTILPTSPKIADDSQSTLLKIADDPLNTLLNMSGPRCQNGWDQLCTELACFCYQLGPGGKEWEGAQNFCTRQSADLALIESAEEEKLLQQYLHSKLGVRMAAVWVKLLSFSFFSNWGTSPTEKCGIMDRFGLEEIDCSYKGINIAGLCKKKALPRFENILD